MKSIFLIIFVFTLFLTQTSYAIEWITLKSTSGNEVKLDKDSIKEYNHNYFYNIKLKTKNNEEKIITIQSSVGHSFSARIKYYTPKEYEDLDGDYENITKNITKDLEPVSIESRVYACYKEVHKLMQIEARPNITF